MLLRSGWGPGYPEIQHMPEMSLEARSRLHGTARIEPVKPLVAGEEVRLTFTFEIGEEIPCGGQLGIAWRWPLDWTDLQSDHPEQAGFVACSGLSCTYHPYSGVEPWHHYLALRVESRPLRCGERVQVVCGERSHGGAGWRAPTCTAKAAGFLMLIDPQGKNRWIRLPDPPTFPILPGPIARLLLIAPSAVVVGERAEVLVRAEDRWGNPTLLEDVLPTIEGGTGTQADVGEVRVLQDPPAYWGSVRFSEASTVTLRATIPGTDWVAHSNPIRVHAQRPEQRVFWGDFHSGQCEIGCGLGTLSDHYRFARDAAGLQFITHQGNDHYVTCADWQHTRQTTEEFYEPGRYVPFLGCEWSPPTRDGGDRNVAYLHDEPRLRRSGRFFVETNPDPEPDLPRAPEFLAALKDQEVLINMHVGGRPTNLDYHEPAIERLAEIHSTHGTSEWFVLDALSRGYRVGITAGSDGVMGRPGACQPGWRLLRNLPNGLTAVLAEELTRESVWNALRSRRCYATTGPRILLHVEVDGQPMGAEYQTKGCPLIQISVVGTAALERIDLLRGTQVLCSWNLARATTRPGQFLRLLWGGTQKRGTARAQTVTWDGSLTLTHGRIAAVRPVGYFAPLDGLWQPDPHTLAWRSATAGNEAGVVLEIEGDEATAGRFSSEPCCFDFSLNQVSTAPLVVAAGGVERQVQIGPAPCAEGPRKAELSFRDMQPVEGASPYWVRVVQVDQAKAWSSPVYVSFSSGR
jgi:hypothetical protein